MTHTLSEYESKQLLADAGIPIPQERLASSADEAVKAAEEQGYPVALKLCGRGIAHKTERNLVRLDLGDAEDVRLGQRVPEEGLHRQARQRQQGDIADPPEDEVHPGDLRVQPLVTDRGSRSPAATDALQAGGFHQPLDALSANMDAFSRELGVDTRRTIGLL